MQKVLDTLPELASMKKYPKELYSSGNTNLLAKRKVSIVGTRKPSKYTRELTHKLASLLAQQGICIVSGGAMGVDAVAHTGAGSVNTIAVLPCGIDIKYPAVNTKLLSEIEKKGLLLSQFEVGFRSRSWSFVTRNELVVALGEILIVSEADVESGSMRSVAYALEMGKEIFVLPQRLTESKGTNTLLQEKKAKAIYDIDTFVRELSGCTQEQMQRGDAFQDLCASTPTYEALLAKFPQRTFEAELSGEIEILGGKVFLK